MCTPVVGWAKATASLVPSPQKMTTGFSVFLLLALV
jgi:hypothetical protein